MMMTVIWISNNTSQVASGISELEGKQIHVYLIRLNRYPIPKIRRETFRWINCNSTHAPTPYTAHIHGGWIGSVMEYQKHAILQFGRYQMRLISICVLGPLLLCHFRSWPTTMFNDDSINKWIEEMGRRREEERVRTGYWFRFFYFRDQTNWRWPFFHFSVEWKRWTVRFNIQLSSTFWAICFVHSSIDA